MANEFAFMFINIEDTLAQYKEGMIDEPTVVEQIQNALDSYQGEIALNRNLSNQQRSMAPTVDQLMMK